MATEGSKQSWKSVPANELPGKCVTRTKSPDGIKDHSFQGGSVLIAGVQPSGHIFYYGKGSFSLHLLNPIWNDDGWVEAPMELCAPFYADFLDAVARQEKMSYGKQFLFRVMSGAVKMVS